ncbi:MAG: hypothetical protein IPO27_15020 [Bacteroidetes bacterium]|nr:hypothetical protein [Bacteroidota bacterium]
MYGKTEDKRLREIFTSMRGMDAEVAAVNPKAEAAELKAFLNKVFVDNDSERIYASDIKKLVQWYQILRNRDNIDELLKEEEVSTEEEVASDVTAQTQDPQLATTETIEEAAPKKTRKKKDSDELSDDTATAEKPKKPRAAKKKEE